LVEFTGLSVGRKRLQVDLKDAASKVIASKVEMIDLNAAAENQLAALEFNFEDGSMEASDGSPIEEMPATADENRVFVNVEFDLRRPGTESAPVTLGDVKGWIHDDCQKCHNSETAAAGIDLSKFPFLLNGRAPADSDSLNWKVVDSLTAEHSVSQMPKPSAPGLNDNKWSAEKIGVMSAWALGGFLTSLPVAAGIEVDDFIGTVKLELDSDGVISNRELILLQGESAKNLFSIGFKIKKTLTAVSGNLQIFDPTGSQMAASKKFAFSVAADGDQFFIKWILPIEN
jgi:hypothetical protein